MGFSFSIATIVEHDHGTRGPHRHWLRDGRLGRAFTADGVAPRLDLRPGERIVRTVPASPPTPRPTDL